jgi:adenylate kinase family enzyme
VWKQKQAKIKLTTTMIISNLFAKRFLMKTSFSSNKSLLILKTMTRQQQQQQQQKQYKIKARMISSTSATYYRHEVNDNDTTPSMTSPGSQAFIDCERMALIDLFDQHAITLKDHGNDKYINEDGLTKLLNAVGEKPTPTMLKQMFDEADLDGNGAIDLKEFLTAADTLLGGAPAGIVLLCGGPGCGKGTLAKRLEEQCGLVHLSSGDLLRNEVERGTVLGKEVKDVMECGGLVSSAVIVTLIRRALRGHGPGRRVLLDGFPRSPQNAADLVELGAKPELAINLECDDTILIERILNRAAKNIESGEGRSDDNIHTALKRLRTFHKMHRTTMDFLHENHVPIVNLDCSGTADQVWNQLLAIGRLVRPAVWIDTSDLKQD